MRIEEIFTEPLVIHRNQQGENRHGGNGPALAAGLKEQAAEMMHAVGLDEAASAAPP